MSSPRTGGEHAVQASAWRWIRAAAALATIFLGYQLLLAVQAWALAVLSVLLYVAFGGVLALVAWPAVDWLERRRVPRAVAVGMMVCLALALLLGLGYLLGTGLAREVRDLTSRLPRWLAELQAFFNGNVSPLLAVRGIHVTFSSLATSGSGGGALLARLPQLLFTGVAKIVQLVVDAVIVLVVAIWLLADGRNLRRSVLAYLPARPRSAVAFGLDAIVVVIGGYVRAQLMMALLIGILAAAGSAALRLPFPIVIGVVAGVFELVPIVGPFAGAAVAMLLALTVSPLLVLSAALLFLGIHLLEGYILAPRVQAHFVRIHPLYAFLALFAGIEVGGFLGALFAVPVASLLSVFMKAGLGDWRRQRPELFRADAADPYLERYRRLLDDFGSGPIAAALEGAQQAAQQIAPPAGRGGRRSRRTRRPAAFRALARSAGVRAVLGFLRRHWLESVAVVSLAGLIVAVDPLKLWGVYQHANLTLVAVMLPLAVSIYVLRGLGWWIALRHVGVEISPFRAVYIMITGQTLIFMPTGDLARVALVKRTGASGRDEGTIAGTIAFQELLFLGLLGLGVLPRVAMRPDLALLVLLLVGAHAGVVALIVWRPAYERAVRLVERIRMLRRFDGQLRSLREAFLQMLSPWNVAGVLTFNALAALGMFALFYLALLALGVGRVGFAEATFAYGLGHILSGLSFLPGGVGSLEAILTALLATKGVPASTGAACALLYRAFNDVVMAMLGALTSLLVKRAAGRRQARRRQTRPAPG